MGISLVTTPSLLTGIHSLWICCPLAASHTSICSWLRLERPSRSLPLTWKVTFVFPMLVPAPVVTQGPPG